jgi:hypothetical protein
MSIALTVKHLLACGASHEAVVKAVEEIEAAKRAKGTERVRKHRNACNVTDVTGSDLSPIPPLDNNININISPRGNRGSGTNPRALGTNPRSAPCLWMPSFEQFWEVFPRRVGKGAAKKAYSNAAKRAEFAEITAGARRYAAECAGREVQYIKMPATWLNADCWLDEPERKTQTNVVGFRKEFPPEPPRPERTPEEQAAIDAQIRKAIKRP